MGMAEWKMSPTPPPASPTYVSKRSAVSVDEYDNYINCDYHIFFKITYNYLLTYPLNTLTYLHVLPY